MPEAGCDIGYIQELLGHAKRVTTEMYRRVSIRIVEADSSTNTPGRAEPGQAGKEKKGQTELTPFGAAAFITTGSIDFHWNE